MKKLLVTLTILLTGTLLWAGVPAKVQTLMNEYKHHDGFDHVSIGPLGMTLMKGIVLSDKDLDAEDRAALGAFESIRRLTILDFEDAQADVKARFISKLQRILNGMDLILETKDSDSRLSIYGVDDGRTVRDCILFDPDGTLIVVRGKIGMDKLMELAN